MSVDKIIERLESLLKEELWGRINPKDISINRFRTLDDFYNAVAGDGAEMTVSEKCREHLDQYPGSVIAMYLLGLISYNKDTIDNKSFLIELLNIYVSAQKWTVVEHIADRILEYGENRVALRSLALALEKLKRVKDAIPIWEELIRINRFDSDVARKLAYAIADDKARSASYLRLALEGFIKDGNFTDAAEIMDRVIESSFDEIHYFEKIERLLSEAQQRDVAAGMFKKLYEHYSDSDDSAIEILKKVLRYNQDDQDARKKLVKHYQSKYGSHSQFEQFLQIARLSDSRAPVKAAIESFENNIVFDVGNYVHHRTWGLGLIRELGSAEVVIDFTGKENHRMSIQMALQSLTPVQKTHLYVRQAEDAEGMKKLFSSDFLAFFRIHIESYGRKITVAQLKKDLIPLYVEEKNWTKWWNKARTIIKKDPELALSEVKKDEIMVREKPVTYFEDLLVRFRSAASFSARLTIALDLVNNVPADEATDSIEEFVSVFKASSEEGSNTKLILSYFILSNIADYAGIAVEGLDAIRGKVIEFIRTSHELPMISAKITSYDNKKVFVGLIREVRQDWMEIACDFLFETPIRIHKYVFNMLIREHGFRQLNRFVERAIVGYRESPEIFCWIARSILSGAWKYEWLDYSRKNLVLSLFRLLADMKKLESRNPRIRTTVLDIIYGGDFAVLGAITAESDEALCARLYNMAATSEYSEEWQLEKLRDLIRARFPEFNPQQGVASADGTDFDDEEIWVTKAGFDRKTEELAQMVNSEMVQLSRELSGVADLSGDMRENVEYNSLMEKQTILKKSISTLEEELKRAKIIDPARIQTDMVMPGTRVEIERTGTPERFTFDILGPWDADFEKRILSYRSGVARTLMRKRIGDEVELFIGDDVGTFRIITITQTPIIS